MTPETSASAPANRPARGHWPRFFQRAGDSVPPGPAAASLDGRWLVALLAAIWGLLLFSFLQTREPMEAWAAFGVPYMGAPFADLYPFPAAQQTLQEGGIVYRPMPVEKWHRPYNYPALWLTFMRFPAGAIPLLGAAMIVTWLTALAASSGRLTVRQGLALGVLVGSPATVLALERANTDVIIFCLLAGVLVLLRNQKIAAAWTGLTLAAVLKLFPAFAFVCFLRLGWRRAWPWVSAAAIGVGLLCVLQLEEMRGVLRETPTGGMFSYGSTVWVHVANILFQQKTGVADAFTPYLAPASMCGLALAAAAFFAGARRLSGPDDDKSTDGQLDAFRMGAGIFLATFLFGSHFVYRLIFLLPCVPWLARRAPGENAALTRIRAVALVAIGVSLWANPFWAVEFYFVRELALWTLLPTLAWLFGRALPPCPIPRWLALRSPAPSAPLR